jgi:hypothetical protein
MSLWSEKFDLDTAQDVDQPHIKVTCALTLHPKSSMEALFAARQCESTEGFKEMYYHQADSEAACLKLAFRLCHQCQEWARTFNKQ